MGSSGVLKTVAVWTIVGLAAIGMIGCNNTPGGGGLGGGGLGDPDIDVFPLQIVFNEDDPTSTNPSTITVSNNGTGVLSVTATAVDGSAAFSVTDGTAPFVVAAGASRTIEITFGTISIDTETAILRIESDDPDEGTIEVQLLGGASNIITDDIDQDRTFANLFSDPTEPDYFFDGSISVTGDISVEPGVTFAFEPGAVITVLDAGSINLVGTAAEPIVMTGTVETAGNWIGINIFSNNPRNEIRFAEIAFGGNRLGSGQRFEANLYVQSSGSLAISDTTITDGRGYGLVVEEGAILSEFARNSFARNQEAPLQIPANLIGALDDDSTFSGVNANEYIEVLASSIEDDAMWSGQDVPYRFDGTSIIDADVVLLPGFAAEFESDAELRVSATGSLSAVGTADNPITFTGATEAVGFWRGVNIFSTNPLNELTNCVVAHAGSALSSGQTDRAGVYLQNSASLTLTNTRIESSGGFGFVAETGASLIDFAANVFLANTEAAVDIPATLAGMMDSGSMFAGGNGNDWVNVDGVSVTAAATWSALDVPYRFEDSSTTLDAAITIEAGASLAFASNAGLLIADSGSLLADASSGDPILFTAETEYASGAGTAGYWGSLNFFSNSASNILANVIVEFGGGQLGTGQNVSANVYVQFGASLNLTNSVVRSSGEYGTWTETGGTLTESGNTFSNNATGDVGTP